MTDARSADAGAKVSWFELFRGRIGLYTLLLNTGTLFFAIDNFLIATLMPSIVADIGGVGFYSWAMMLFVVGAIVGAAGYGPARARFGGRSALALAGGIFATGALGCALAPEISVLLTARLFQGVGGGLIIAGAMSSIGTLYPPHLRTRAIATISLTWILAAVIGPIQGGFFAEIGWWRGAFLLYVPIGAAFLAGVWLKFPKDADAATAESRSLRFPVWRIAFLGLGILCVGSSGQVDHPVISAGLIAVAIGIVWYAFRRDANAANRLFPSRPLSLSEPVGLIYWGHILTTSAFMAVAIYLPLILTVLYAIPPLYVGFANGSLSIGWSIAAALVAGFHGTRERVVVTAGPICLLVGSMGLGAVTLTGGPFALVMVLAVLVGVGVGIFHVHMTARAMTAARPGEESITASSVMTIRTLGMAFGAAIAGAIANLAGLLAVASEESVRVAVSWVYLFNAVPLLLAIGIVLRFFRMERRAR